MKEFDKNKRRINYLSTSLSSPEYFIVNLLSQKLCDKINSYFNPANACAGLKVLDLGCGSQPFKSKLEALGLQYYSADVVAIEGVEIDYILNFSTRISETDINSVKFDFIICSEVAEHIPEWDFFFSNLNLITKKDSVILLSSPFIYFLHEVPHDYFRATPFAYEYYAAKYSFGVIEIEKAGDYYDVSGTIQNASPEYVTYSKYGLIKIATIALNKISNIKNKLKYSSLFRKHFTKHSPYYLSNIVVLKRN